MESVDLPKGWFKEEVIRKSGLSAGKTDIYYYGPDGKKYRSKPQIARELGTDCDLAPFDFKSGAMISQASIVRRAKGKKTAYDFAKGFRSEASISPPVRQTASIFKQPVTVIRGHTDSRVQHDLKHGPVDSLQPRQLFWEKSLTDLKCSDIDEETLKCITLPSKIKGIGPELSTENLLQSIAAALHLSSNPVVGQSQSVTKFTKNPTVYINTSQPLMQQVVITDDDIRQQETKVEGSRKKLQELLAAIEKSNRENLTQEDRPSSAGSSHESNTSSRASPAPPCSSNTASKATKRKSSPNRSADHHDTQPEKQIKVEQQEVVEETSKGDASAVETKDVLSDGVTMDTDVAKDTAVAMGDDAVTNDVADADAATEAVTDNPTSQEKSDDDAAADETAAVEETQDNIVQEKVTPDEEENVVPTASTNEETAGGVDEKKAPSPIEKQATPDTDDVSDELLKTGALDKSEESVSDTEPDNKLAEELLGTDDSVAMDTN